MHAFILAGGFATRLWPLTEHRAKPLLPLAGVPLVEHLVRDIPKDIPITISTNATFQQPFEEWVQEYGRSNMTILIEQTTSDDQKLGALGATAQWIEQQAIHDDLFILAGDNYCGFSFQKFLNAHEDDTALIAVHDIEDREKAKSFGTVITDGNTVIAFEEKPKEPKTTLVNTGCYSISASMIPVMLEYAKVKPDDIGGIFEEFLQRHLPVQAFRFTEDWFDIGSFAAYIEATKTLVGHRTLTNEGSVIEQTTCEGSIVIGEHSTVRNAQLENVVIFDNCLIEECTIRDCVLDSGCTLKGVDIDGKMLRKGTKLVRR